MKKYTKVVLALFGFVLLSLASCDVIEDPIKGDGGPPPPTGGDTVYRNVFIEDFTGHRCKNCPKASKVLKDLTDLYGDRVVPMAIHSGASTFTDPNPPDYPMDFTTQDGDDIASFFGGVPAQPIGMVSRRDYSGSGFSHWKTYTSWPSQTASIIDEIAIADITITATVNGTNLVTNATVTFLGEQTGTYKVGAYLKESEIVAPQLMPDDTRDVNYVHQNVFRDALTQPMGDALASGTIADSTAFDVSYNTALDASWNTSNMQVVVVVIDDSNQEVMQAVQVDVQ